MAKVTIVLEDVGSTVEVSANFEQPGVHFEQMAENPTKAVALGLMALQVVKLSADRIEGSATNDDGSPLALAKILGAESEEIQ